MKRFLSFIVTLCSFFFFSVTAFAEIPRGSLVYSAEDTNKVLQQKTEYNRAYSTLFSLIASSAAYAPDNGIEAAYLRSHGWDFAPNRITDGKTTVHFITAKGIMADGKPLYVISFRGSADKKDWAADFVTGQAVYGGKTPEEAEKIAGSLPDGAKELAEVKAAAEKAGTRTLPKVHKGFNSYAALTLRMLLTSGSYEFLEQFRKEKDARLLLTGHSLGGAVATIVGQRLIDFGFAPDRLQVITFGAPAVGNKAFKQLYGDRLDLIRVTNTQDPVPLTFQAVLRNYKQFGEEVRFRIPKTFNNMNHFMNLYLDAGLKNYYAEVDDSVKQRIMQEEPEIQHSAADQPTVLLYVEGNEAGKKGGNTDVKTTMQLLERFILNEYRALFPNYVVVRSPLDPYEAMRTQAADYLLLLKFHADTNQYNNNWFLTVEQTLSDKNGNVLASGSAARRTSPLAGNILAAMEVIGVEKLELLRQMPWLQGDIQK
jgi:hypothetical protein